MDNIESVIMGAIGGGVLVVPITIYTVLKNPEKIEKWVALIYGYLSKFYKGFEYLATKNEIQGKLNSFVNNLETNTIETFQRASIEWVARDKDEDIVFEDGETIILLRDRNHRNKNLVHAAYFFTSKILLRKTKARLSKNLKTTIDLFATKLLLDDESKACAEQFMNDYFLPEIERSEEVKKYTQKFVNINRLGIFFPILIHELSLLGNKLILSKVDESVLIEVKNLIDFLERRSLRSVGDATIKDTFIGNYMKCAIKVVATKGTRDRKNYLSQKFRIFSGLKLGCENVYVVGSSERDSKNFIDKVVQLVMQEYCELILHKKLEFACEINVDGKTVKTSNYFVHLHNPSIINSFI